MKTSLMAAAMAAAILSAATAVAADRNPQSQNSSQSSAVMKRTTPSSQEQGMPVAIKIMPISLQTGDGVRRRAAIAALFLIGAAAPCLRAEGKVFIPSGDC